MITKKAIGRSAAGQLCKLRAFPLDNSGAVMVEYGLILLLIVVGCVGLVAAIGTTVLGFFSNPLFP